VEPSLTRARKILLGVLVLLALLVGAAAWYLAPIGPTATGYAARILCSGVFVSDRSVEDLVADLPDNPLAPYLRFDVDRDEQTLRATLLGLYATTAHHTEGLGCTLADDDPGFVAAERLERPVADQPWPDGDQPGPVPDGVDLAGVEAAIDTAFAEDDPEGRARNTRAVVVVHQGRLVAERYADGFDPDTPMLGWSATKSVGNAIIGRLVHDGRLALDDDRLLEAWAADDRARITLAHLLEMRSGLAFDETYDVGTDATTMLFTPVDAGAYAAAEPLEHPPGTHWQYSSGSTNVVCDLAHTASGMGPELAHELVFAPLGMSSALIEPDLDGGLICSSFGYATPRDWARFGQFFLADGVWGGERLLPEGWVEYSTTAVEADNTDDLEDPYGASWWLNEAPGRSLRMPSVPPDAYWASGFDGQQVVVIPSEDLVVLRLGLAQEFDGIDWGLEPLLAGVIDALG
jgi:CubicO group peptidase (beta-lactamase class C family)